jgi:hypothetical protein
MKKYSSMHHPVYECANVDKQFDHIEWYDKANATQKETVLTRMPPVYGEGSLERRKKGWSKLLGVFFVASMIELV